jgi:hypothetical protein
METLAVKDTQAIEDKALKIVNTTLLGSDLKKRAFCGAHFPLAMNLVLTTGPLIVKSMWIYKECIELWRGIM